MIDTEQLKPYLVNDFQLIPLFKWDHKTKRNKVLQEDGKRPIDSNWTKKPYDNAKMILHAKKGQNVGVRLKANQLILDVDPRNFPKGKDSFKAFCAATKFDPEKYPMVRTGGGGFHFYTLKPDDLSVLDSLEGYEGVEFKTFGRQVVAAGSRHPSGAYYRWDDQNPFALDLSEITMAPSTVLNLIRRPSALPQNIGKGGGEYDQEEIAQMLEALDPTEFRDHEKWLYLMQACHHASNGEARQEFVDWSTLDEEYKGHAALIGRRWDSLHLKRDGKMVTFRTLHKFLIDAGKMDAIVRNDAAEDFSDAEDIELPGDEDFADVPEHEKLTPLERLSQTYTVVMDNGKPKAVKRVKFPGEQNKRLILMSRPDFRDSLANKRIETTDAKGKATAVPIADTWWEWPHRKTMDGIIFDPEKNHPNFFNLWDGWAVDPVPGDWSLTKELMREVLCDGDEEAYEYLLNWIAYMIQKPNSPAEVAICFHGDMGTGKSTLGNLLTYLAGQHGLAITNPELLTGRFNGHLQDKIMLFADEAISSHDKKAISMLRALITEHRITFEKKGKDAMANQPNRLHIMIASNDEKFIPASLVDGERRFFIMKVNNKKMGDKAFFKALQKQLYKDGGAEAMFHDLRVRDIGDWAPRENIPQTQALSDQKLRNMGLEPQWWFEKLEEGNFGVPLAKEDEDWRKGPIHVFVKDFKDDFEVFCTTGRKALANANNRGISRYFFLPFKKLCPNLDNRINLTIPDDRLLDLLPEGSSARQAKSVLIPKLSDCREAFVKITNLKLKWMDEQITENGAEKDDSWLD